MSDPKQRIVVDGLEFAGIFRFHRILRAAVTSMQPPRLVVGLLMLVLLVGIGRAWDAGAGRTVPPEGLLGEAVSPAERAERQWRLREALAHYLPDESRWPAAPFEAAAVLETVEQQYRHRRETFVRGRMYNGQVTGSLPAEEIRAHDREYVRTRAELLALLPRGPFAATAAEVVSGFERIVRGAIELEPPAMYDAAADLLVRLPCALWERHRAFAIVYGLFALVVLALGGGALGRMAACDFAGQERLSIREAMDFALGNWVKIVLAPTLPLIVAAVVAGLMILPGLLMFPFGDVLGGLLYGISMVLGFVLAFVLIGYAIGAPLLLPAVVCENCDAADAQQRVYAYVLSRPLHLLGYGLTGLAGLVLGYLVIALIASSLLNFAAALAGTFTANSALVGAGGFSVFDLAPMNAGDVHYAGHSGVAASIIGFWQRLVVDIVGAYVIAYLFTAATMVYLLMRRVCDGQDIEEIWRPGLTPGTLVPLPRPRVIDDNDGGNGGDADRSSPSTPIKRGSAAPKQS